MKNITKIGTNKWKADHLHSEYAVISIPNGFHFEETEITLSKSNGIITLEFSNPDKWNMTFTKITDPSNGGGGGGGGGSTIDTILAQDFPEMWGIGFHFLLIVRQEQLN